jgi:hypothetical protein
MFYIHSGRVKLSILSRIGKEGVAAILGRSGFSMRAAWRGSRDGSPLPAP